MNFVILLGVFLAIIIFLGLLSLIKGVVKFLIIIAAVTAVIGGIAWFMGDNSIVAYVVGLVP